MASPLDPLFRTRPAPTEDVTRTRALLGLDRPRRDQTPDPADDVVRAAFVQARAARTGA